MVRTSLSKLLLPFLMVVSTHSSACCSMWAKGNNLEQIGHGIKSTSAGSATFGVGSGSLTHKAAWNSTSAVGKNLLQIGHSTIESDDVFLIGKDWQSSSKQNSCLSVMLSWEEYNIEGISSESSSTGIHDEAEGVSTLNISSSRTTEDFFFLPFLFSGVDAVVVESGGGLCLTLAGLFSLE